MLKKIESSSNHFKRNCAMGARKRLMFNIAGSWRLGNFLAVQVVAGWPRKLLEKINWTNVKGSIKGRPKWVKGRAITWKHVKIT